jgi:glucose/mannose-6-phosphate isomerase
MDLDNLERIRELDAQGMLGEIDRLPQQLEYAWRIGQEMPLPGENALKAVFIVGMGGSAIAGDLLAAYAAPLARVPIIVSRGYELPAYAAGPQNLLIASSHSGDTEETLSAFEEGAQRGMQRMAVTTGGELARRAESDGCPLWRFEHMGQPRAAVGFSFGLLLAALRRLGVLPPLESEVHDAAEAMKQAQTQLGAEVPTARNPAKRMAGQWVGRWPVILGSDFLSPVARRWRTQISEVAKSLAQYEELPEADHNMLAGVMAPEDLIMKTMVVFLRGSHNHPRNRLRVDATREVLMVEGFNTDVYEAPGETRLAQQWSALHFGDYCAFYLAMANGVNPSPVEAIEDLKRRIAGSSGAGA